jgi:Interferon-related developmental regulator (IFRD)
LLCSTARTAASSCHRCKIHTVCRRDTLASMFLNSLRRGGALEAALAARCLGLQGVTLGAGEECEQ